MTEYRKAANRVGFNQAEEEVLEGDEFVGLGMLGQQEGSGRIRMVQAKQKQKITKQSQKKIDKAVNKFGSTKGTSGLASSLAFTPVQGIELVNPMAAQKKGSSDTADGTKSYFSELSGFRSSLSKQS